MKNLRLKSARAAKDLSQEDLARLCGVSRQTIISLENGRYNPSLLLARKLAVCFGKQIEDIFVFEEDEG